MRAEAERNDQAQGFTRKGRDARHLFYKAHGPMHPKKRSRHWDFAEKR